MVEAYFSKWDLCVESVGSTSGSVGSGDCDFSIGGGDGSGSIEFSDRWQWVLSKSPMDVAIRSNFE